MSTWPTVDIYIPSYNEPLEVVRDTVLAAQCIDYPADKMKIYLLDDGKRSEFAVFAADVGVGYITRNDNKHAKAGNLNHAMTLTQGELICVFDCDHVATRVFLQATVGGFLKDPMLALVQTPHYFYSPDPFERNLSVGRNIPNEGMLFYGPIQQGNDNWNATFFCGSCAVIRRKALDDIGGFAVETVTEDAHTALKFQRLGWKSSFIDIPLAAGLATERLVVHVIQRTRWARGMTQIFRLDNPLLGRGLTFQQRLCYLSAMLYYQFALPRVVFVTAPLAYLLFNLNIIYSSASLIVSYALPHLFLAIYVGSRMNGRYRYSFWGEIYDIVLAFHLVLPTLVTMIFPKRGKFNVTDKGGLLDVGYFDFTVVRPHLVVACLLAVGVIVGIVRAIGHDYFGSDPNVIALNVGWGLYSLIFLLAAIAVARETRQVRKTIRIDVNIPVLIHYASGIVSRSHTADLSMGGCRIAVPDDRHLQDDIEEIELILQSGAICIPAEQVTADENFIRLKFDENIPLSLRRELVRVVLARADAWINPPRPQDNPFRSFFTILRCVFELFWLSWKTRRGRRQQKPVASTAQEDGQL
jgi:cellulose synthase (UDP-forming)